MAEKKRMAKQPMLYITQPNFKPAEVPMQTSFRSQRTPSKPETDSGGSLYEKELRLRNQSSASPAERKGDGVKEESIEEEPRAEKEKEQEEKPSSRGERKQRFTDLSLEDKVKYFFQLSPHVPRVKCEVTAGDTAYRGYITDYKEGVVHMKTFQRPFQKEIPFKEIKDIRLLGF
ncbi:hypothetical protein H0266_06050 [Halobacillus locisalis]|uniref:Spore coat protein CotO n=1 Tax=Halobacillus locisalis TaxID=220753 RepID=A0A838CQW6_9BACI|nr:CotO family spore coat protein [Halobacillus locisalis]MBA2174467.1 hypothetical protein [Halobacillus locisalis]